MRSWTDRRGVVHWELSPREKISQRMVARFYRAIQTLDALAEETMPAWERERQAGRIWRHQRRLAMRDATEIAHLQSSTASSLHSRYHAKKKGHRR